MSSHCQVQTRPANPINLVPSRLFAPNPPKNILRHLFICCSRPSGYSQGHRRHLRTSLLHCDCEASRLPLISRKYRRAEDTGVRMAAYKLVLIRHGESCWNQENRFCGWFDADLSETGEREARRGGEALKGDASSYTPHPHPTLLHHITSHHTCNSHTFKTCKSIVEFRRVSMDGRRPNKAMLMQHRAWWRKQVGPSATQTAT